METKVYNQKGEDAGKIKLPENIFGLHWNADLVHQVISSISSNKRANTADTKGRGEVRGGGRKPWKQKGTGRARHGSSRSPIWKGGGVTHGPSVDRNYKKKINKKMMAKALFTILSKKLKSKDILFLDQITLAGIKTQKAAEIQTAISKIAGFEKITRVKGNNALFAIPEKSENTLKSFRNIPSIYIERVQNINPLEVLNYKYLILVEPEKCIKFFETKIGPANAKKPAVAKAKVAVKK